MVGWLAAVATRFEKFKTASVDAPVSSTCECVEAENIWPDADGYI